MKTSQQRNENFNWAFFTWIALTLFISVPCAPLESASSPINSMRKASLSLVNVKADAAGAVRGKPAAVIDPATKMLLIVQPIRAVQQSQTGAGVIIDPSGLIVTNHHTIQYGTRIIVTLYNGTEVTANLLHTFPEGDIAFLGIDPPFPLQAIKPGDSSTIKVGQTVYAIGNSPIIKNSFGEGVVTGLGKRPWANNTGLNNVDMIQTNFNIYEGDSGAPMLNREGQLLGIFVGRLTQVADASYALPVNSIQEKLSEFISTLPQKK